MKNALLTITTILGATITVGCAKEVTDDIISEEEKTCTLNIVTRSGETGDEEGDEDSTPVISEGRIYVMSGTHCVGMLTLSEGATATALTLPAGSYEVYAVGGNDLARFTLPTEEEATTASTIGVKANSAMDDLLTQTASVTLTDGEVRQLNMTLERRVIRIDEVTIQQVPEEVTAVDLMVEPTYSTTTLAAEYGTATKAVTIVLTEATEGTWQVAQAQQYAFPTKGKPTITVRFTTSSGVKSYSYEASEAWPANHKVSIVGTYTEPRGVSLSGTLTGTEWGEDITVSFDFDETNSGTTTDDNNDDEPTETPAVGTLYKGCYVVAAEGKNITVVSNTERAGFSAQSSNSALTELGTALESWQEEDGISGTWRIPTVEEVTTFLTDPTYIPITSGIIKYYCMDGETVRRAQTGSNRSVTINDVLNNEVSLRPVMDITLP